MSYMVCHMSLFLRAGHLGHLKNSSNLPLPGPQEEWDVLPKGDLLLFCRQDVLCVLCALQPSPPHTQAFVLCFPFKVRASLPADVLTLVSDSW